MNRLKLNKQKSAIVKFRNKHARTYLNSNQVEGVPVLDCYKYLGLILNAKTQIAP